jgi:hypothetical protein
MEFERRFATEEACRAALVRLRWPDGMTRCVRVISCAARPRRRH